jgi:beta-carotene 3-hydroxylase
MTALEKILIVVAAIAAMEWVAWAAHKYIMHGWGWGWHRDHHEPHSNVLEKNDLFGVVGTVAALTMFTVGFYFSEPLWWAAVGVTAYGVIYTFIHDGIVHQRFFRWVPKRGYAKRLVQAHKLHHATASREGGVSFGFVLARDPAALKAELKAQLRSGRAILREAID